MTCSRVRHHPQYGTDPVIRAVEKAIRSAPDVAARLDHKALAIIIARAIESTLRGSKGTTPDPQAVHDIALALSRVKQEQLRYFPEQVVAQIATEADVAILMYPGKAR